MKIELLVLLLTTRCNLRCLYCYLGCQEEGEELSTDQIKALLKRLSSAPREIVISGGEPTLFPERLAEVIGLLRRHFPRTRLSLQTNGTLLSRPLLSFFRQMKVGLGLSLDGPPEINEALRGQTEQVLRGLRLLEEEGLSCGVTVTITRKNVAFLGQTALFLSLFPAVASFGLDLLRPVGRAKEEDLPLEGELKQGLEDLNQSLSFLRGHGSRLRWREAERSPTKDGYCPAARARSLVLTPKGELYPCASLVGRQEFLLGQLDGRWRKISLQAGCGPCQAICPGRCPSRFLLSPRAGDLDCLLHQLIYSVSSTGRSATTSRL